MILTWLISLLLVIPGLTGNLQMADQVGHDDLVKLAMTKPSFPARPGIYSFAAASSFSPLAIASSIVPTFRNACSGR